MALAKTPDTDTGTHVFRLNHSSHGRNLVKAWAFFVGFLVCAVGAAALSIPLFLSSSHAFTPYLRWQDMLTALLWAVALLSCGGCILILRFLYAFGLGYRREMLTIVERADGSTISVRDLSLENLSSIFWLTGTTVACFTAALVGLVPEMFLGWSWHLTPPLLALVATIAVVLLGIAGLVLTLPALVFVVIGVAGSISLLRNLGALHTYRLTGHIRLAIDNDVLTILYPEEPESTIDLKLLSADDRRVALQILYDHWRSTDAHGSPLLGEEIQAALDAVARDTNDADDVDDANGADGARGFSRPSETRAPNP